MWYCVKVSYNKFNNVNCNRHMQGPLIIDWRRMKTALFLLINNIVFIPSYVSV